MYRSIASTSACGGCWSPSRRISLKISVSAAPVTLVVTSACSYQALFAGILVDELYGL